MVKEGTKEKNNAGESAFLREVKKKKKQEQLQLQLQWLHEERKREERGNERFFF